MTDIEVDVWTWPLAVSANYVAELATVLSADERARADRFLAAADRDSYIVGRGRLRRILAPYVGQAPADLRFGYGKAGKPSFESRSAPHFNLSHSGGWAALAVCSANSVGIDIEAVRPIREQIAERYFSSAEVAALSALPLAEQTAAFFRCWTRKEAVVKAIGDGLNIPLDSFTVSVADEANPLMLHVDDAPDDDVASWKLASFSPAAEITGAVALKAARADLRFVLNFRSVT